jgi:hypothetical protein
VRGIPHGDGEHVRTWKNGPFPFCKASPTENKRRLSCKPPIPSTRFRGNGRESRHGLYTAPLAAGPTASPSARQGSAPLRNPEAGRQKAGSGETQSRLGDVRERPRQIRERARPSAGSRVGIPDTHPLRSGAVSLPIDTEALPFGAHSTIFRAPFEDAKRSVHSAQAFVSRKPDGQAAIGLAESLRMREPGR